MEPATNLQVLELASKSMRLTWDLSFGDVSGYKIQIVPMISGPKRQELYVGHTQTSLLVRDLSPETEYQVTLFALNGLTPSEPITTMGKTEPVKVSLGLYKNLHVKVQSSPFVKIGLTVNSVMSSNTYVHVSHSVFTSPHGFHRVLPRRGRAG